MRVTERTLVLLGAGASKEAGVPTTFEMTEELVSRVAAGYRTASAAALHFICGALLAYDSADGVSPFEGLDVERVFAAVELLAGRRTLEVTPFVASWHPAVDALDQRPRSRPAFFDRKLAEGLSSRSSLNGPERLITQLIDSRLKSSADGATYSRLAGEMLDQLRQLVATTAKDVAYLAPLVTRASQLSEGITIVTLNYDLAVEQSASTQGIPLTTGMHEWLRHGRWVWPPTGIRLLKLHGSIDWVWDTQRPERGSLPREGIALTDSPEGEQRPPALVFGQRGKLRAEGPFLGLLAEFEKQLGAVDTLVVIGYSFRDDHVNELIRRWIADDRSRTICVVDPNWPERRPSGPRDFRQALEGHLVPRGADAFAPRLSILRERCSEVLRTLCEAET